MGLSWLQPTYSFLATEDYTQCHDSERIIETGNGNHIDTVIELCIAIAVFC